MATTYIPFNNKMSLKVHDLETPIKLASRDDIINDSRGSIELQNVVKDSFDASDSALIFNSPYGLIHSSLFQPLTPMDKRILSSKYTGIFTASSQLALLIRQSDNKYYLSTIERVNLTPANDYLN